MPSKRCRQHQQRLEPPTLVADAPSVYVYIFIYIITRMIPPIALQGTAQVRLHVRLRGRVEHAILRVLAPKKGRAKDRNGQTSAPQGPINMSDFLPCGGHHLAGESCLPTTLEVFPIETHGHVLVQSCSPRRCLSTMFPFNREAGIGQPPPRVKEYQ